MWVTNFCGFCSCHLIHKLNFEIYTDMPLNYVFLHKATIKSIKINATDITNLRHFCNPQNYIVSKIACLIVVYVSLEICTSRLGALWLYSETHLFIANFNGLKLHNIISTYVTLCVGGSKVIAGQYILYCPATRA